MFEIVVGVAAIVGVVLQAVDLAVKWSRKPSKDE